MRQAIIWTNDGYFTDAYMRHSASMSFNERRPIELQTVYAAGYRYTGEQYYQLPPVCCCEYGNLSTWRTAIPRTTEIFYGTNWTFSYVFSCYFLNDCAVRKRLILITETHDSHLPEIKRKPLKLITDNIAIVHFAENNDTQLDMIFICIPLNKMYTKKKNVYHNKSIL